MSVKKFLPTFILAVLALTAGFFAQDIMKQFRAPEYTNATLYPADFRGLPPISLQDHNGQPFSNAQLEDKWTLLFFGFTNCPDVCPNTLAVLQLVYDQLADLREDLEGNMQVVFVSVDPERDHLEQLKDYTTYFHPEFIGVTGELDNLRTLTRGMSIHFEKHENEENPEDYQVDHYAGVFILNPEGRQHALISPPHTPGVIAQDIRTMIDVY